MSDRPTISAKTKVEVLVRQAICYYCREPLAPSESAVEFDHVKARALGGSDDAANLVAVHKACHRDKTNVDLAKIASENRRMKKRKRATEKRALEQLARRTDLQKLLIRGSDLLVIGESDDEASGTGLSDEPGKACGSRGAGQHDQFDADRADAKRIQKDARPKSRWGKRPFDKGRRFAVRSKDRQADHGRDKNNNAPD